MGFALSLANKLRSHLRDHGLAATACKISGAAFRLGSRAVYRNHVEILLECDLSLSMPDVSSHGLVVREFVNDDVNALRECIQLHNVHPDYALERLAYNLGHGYRAAVGTLDGRIIAYGWLVGQGKSHPAQRLHNIQVGADELFSCDLFVAPRHRKNNMAFEFLVQAQCVGRELGVKRIVTSILETNRRSLWVHHLAGYREICRHRVHTLLSCTMLCGRKAVLRNDLWF
jgi:GNAT superfamily N-acetyltransferase